MLIRPDLFFKDELFLGAEDYYGLNTTFYINLNFKLLMSGLDWIKDSGAYTGFVSGGGHFLKYLY